MKTFKTRAEITAGGTLLLHELPFLDGERVVVTIASPAVSSLMSRYAEKLGGASAEFVKETEAHVSDRMLRETEW